MTTNDQQKILCEQYGSPFCESPTNFKVGIALNVRSGILPINGLRHPATTGTTGWYIWAGDDFSTDPDFFVPLHVEHLKEWCPMIIKYLGLAPGWRFLITPKYEDVWEDPKLLEV